MENIQTSSLIPLIRADLKENFRPYSSAGSEAGKAEGMTYLNANENPFPHPKLEGYNRYDVQQPEALIQTMARTFGVEASQLVATRGSDESIDLLIRMMCRANKESVLICPPTFGMYQVYATLQGATIVPIPLIEKEGSFLLDTKQIIASAKDPANNVKLIFLPNPGAPSGTLFERSALEEIITALQGHCAIVIDEAYIDFTAQPSFAEDIHQYPNLLVLRTASKAYALAGERIGCTLCADQSFLEFMRSCLAPYPIPRSVAENALNAFSQTNIQEKINILNGQRDKLAAIFEASELVDHVYPSVANFLLVKFRDQNTARGFYRKALDQKLVLRDMSSKEITESCLRISVGTPEENEKLIKLLQNQGL